MEESKKKVNVAPEEPTTEQLKNYVNQLMAQRNELAKQLGEITSAVNKLPWLFKVLKYDMFFDTTTVEKASLEIKDMLFYEEPTEKEETKEEE